MTASVRLERALREHEGSLERLLAAISRVDPAAWSGRAAPDAWSLREVAEHLVLSFEAAIREIEGRGSLSPRVSRPVTLLLRWLLLPHILFHKSIPIRSGAPQEVRPAGTQFSPEEAVFRLRERGTAFERAIRGIVDPSGRRLRHPYFGPLRPDRFVLLIAAHMDHHRVQFESRH